MLAYSFANLTVLGGIGLLMALDEWRPGPPRG